MELKVRTMAPNEQRFMNRTIGQQDLELGAFLEKLMVDGFPSFSFLHYLKNSMQNIKS